MKISSFEKLTDCRHLNLYAIAYQDRAENERTWHIASRNDPPKIISGRFEIPDAVVIVAQHREHAGLVVVREFRVPLGGYQYGFPAGLVDPGETLENACHRELFEETGLSVDRLIKTSPPVYSTSGMTDEAVAMVYVECSGDISNAGNSSSEDIHPFLVSPEEALSLCREPGQMLDVKTWLVLQAFGETGRVF